MKGHTSLQLDEHDVQIIKELQGDSRLSMRALATRIGLSTPTVVGKVQRLVESGAIKSFTVNLDSAAFGLKDYVVEIKCQPVQQKRILTSLGELRHALLTQDSRIVGIFTGSDKEAVLLYDKMCGIRGVTSVALTPATSYEMNPLRPLIESGARLRSTCYYCRGEIGPAPIVQKIGGRQRFFCCTSCRSLYDQKYRSLQSSE